MKRTAQEKHSIFVKEYRFDRNATRAYIAAGYSEKTARSGAARLLATVNIRAEIDEQDAHLNQKLDLSVEWVVTRLMWRAGFDVRKFYKADGTLVPVAELDDETAYALQGLEIEKLYEHFGKSQAHNTGTLTKIKFADRDRALELLGRHLKMFTDKVEVTGAETLIARLHAGRRRVSE